MLLPEVVGALGLASKDPAKERLRLIKEMELLHMYEETKIILVFRQKKIFF